MSEGVRPANSNDKRMYEQEYRKGADLFQNALKKYETSQSDFQKEEFQDVMGKALNVMNDAAHGLIRKDLEEKNEKIRKDFETFKKYPEDEGASQRLSADVKDAQNSL